MYQPVRWPGSMTKRQQFLVIFPASIPDLALLSGFDTSFDSPCSLYTGVMIEQLNTVHACILRIFVLLKLARIGNRNIIWCLNF